MNKQQRQLLWNLYRALRSPKLHRENFDLRSWVGLRDIGFGQLPEKSTLECGTKACAIGLACTLPSWKKAGFSRTINGAPKFRAYYSWSAVSAGLGIRGNEARYLFSEQSYASSNTGPLAVADRIKTFLRDNA